MATELQIVQLLQHLASVSGKQTDVLLQQQCNIGASQYRILAALEWNPRTQQKTLAANLGQTEPSISRQMALLQKRGMLQALTDPNNKRKHIVSMTPLGMKTTEAATALIRQHFALDLTKLSPQNQTDFTKLLQQLHSSLCKPGRAGACDHSLGL